MVIRELAWQDPAQIFAHFAQDPYVAWFDSQGFPAARARHSMIAIDPFRIVSGAAGRVFVDGEAVAGDAFTVLAREMARFTLPTQPQMPFAGGAAGFLGYELASDPNAVRRLPDVADLVMGFYDLVLGFDHEMRRCWLFSSGLPEPEGAGREARGLRRADAVLRRLETPAHPGKPAPRLAWQRETSRDQHIAHIARTMDYIMAGDIYQANITARFTADQPAGLAAADLHLALRAKSPAPFGAFLACGKTLSIASVSPERFVSLTAQGDIETRPIKGTRPRGATEEADAAFRRDLLDSAKDRAENLMIVDLLRNDISRAASFGSVRVPEFCTLETFAHVHHLVSSIRARLAPGLHAADLLRACFPGGSITGAPKIRAMQIIAALESSPRGPYCGSIAWLGFDGAMDSNIAIRTMTITPRTVSVQAGGGIVADSDPGQEFEEMMVKAGPLLRAFGDIPA